MADVVSSLCGFLGFPRETLPVVVFWLSSAFFIAGLADGTLNGTVALDSDVGFVSPPC